MCIRDRYSTAYYFFSLIAKYFIIYLCMCRVDNNTIYPFRQPFPKNRFTERFFAFNWGSFFEDVYKRQAYENVEKIHFEGAQYRKDIGIKK